MSFGDLLRNLRPRTPGQESRLLDLLTGACPSIDLFWYPGSGRDLTPLLFDVPNNPSGRRILRTNKPNEQRPVLLWMNDYSGEYEHFPPAETLGREHVPRYSDLWGQYGTVARVGNLKEVYELDPGIPLTLFTVTLRNRPGGSHFRGDTGDEYLVVFSHCDSELLLEQAFIKYGITISTVALIRQGGFSGQRRSFSHYADVPIRIQEARQHVGQVDYWVIDAAGQEGRVPSAPALSDYEYVGGPLKWGWVPTRIFARADSAYVREPRPCRFGRSWKSWR